MEKTGEQTAPKDRSVLIPVHGTIRRIMPEKLRTDSRKFSFAGSDYSVTVWSDRDGQLWRVSIASDRNQAEVAALIEVFSEAVSTCLQFGVPLPVLVRKFSGRQDELFSTHAQTTAKVLLGQIFDWLGDSFPTRETV